jgi:hypothetical protein
MTFQQKADPDRLLKVNPAGLNTVLNAPPNAPHQLVDRPSLPLLSILCPQESRQN